MSQRGLVLNREVPGGVAFVHSLRECITSTAERARKTLGVAGPKSEAALREFDRFLSGLGPDDQRLVCIFETNLALHDERFVFTPTQSQGLLLARLGATYTPPAPSDILDEFATAGVCDYIAGSRQTLVGKTALEQELEETKAASSEEETRKQTLEEAISDARAEVERLREEISELTKDNEFLSRFAPEGTPTKATNGARRAKVEGHPGVYLAKSGEYEINYQEDGKTCWKVIGPDLQEAINVREQVTSRTKEAAAA